MNMNTPQQEEQGILTLPSIDTDHGLQLEGYTLAPLPNLRYVDSSALQIGEMHHQQIITDHYSPEVMQQFAAQMLQEFPEAASVQRDLNTSGPEARKRTFSPGFNENVLMTKEKGKSKKLGRPSVKFSEAKNKRDKLHHLNQKIVHLAGADGDEKKKLLKAYLESSYGEGVVAEAEETEIFRKIVQNIVQLIHDLPAKSPLRKPLVQAVGKDIPQAHLKRIFQISESTIKRSKTIDKEDSLLYTLKAPPKSMVTEDFGAAQAQSQSVPITPGMFAATGEQMPISDQPQLVSYQILQL